MNSSIRISAWALLATGLAVAGLHEGSWAAAPRKSARPAARRGGASAQAQRIGSFTFEAKGPNASVKYEPLKDGGFRWTIQSDVELDGPGRTITADTVSIDVPKNGKDISIARASGNVQMNEILEDGRKLSVHGQSLIYNRVSGVIDVAGGVRVQSDVKGGGSVTATGSRSQVNTATNIAHLWENVELTLVKPDTLEGPGQMSGQTLTLHMDTGVFELSGGRTKGSFNLKTPPPKTGNH